MLSTYISYKHPFMSPLHGRAHLTKEVSSAHVLKLYDKVRSSEQHFQKLYNMDKAQRTRHSISMHRDIILLILTFDSAGPAGQSQGEAGVPAELPCMQTVASCITDMSPTSQLVNACVPLLRLLLH